MDFKVEIDLGVWFIYAGTEWIFFILIVSGKSRPRINRQFELFFYLNKDSLMIFSPNFSGKRKHKFSYVRKTAALCVFCVCCE